MPRRPAPVLGDCVSSYSQAQALERARISLSWTGLLYDLLSMVASKESCLGEDRSVNGADLMPTNLHRDDDHEKGNPGSAAQVDAFMGAPDGQSVDGSTVSEVVTGRFEA
jgi:hypothetical protein